MVEIKKLPYSPDIFKLETCCYLSIKIDSFNRRPGATQCYNCNLFNHSSSNCNIRTRCLKCGEPHKTGDCPIKTIIENPTCINCHQKGHLANSHRCPKFPKQKPKKGEASQNRNNSNDNNKSKNNHNIFSTTSAAVRKEISYANIVKNDKQMAPPLDQSEPAKSKPEATPNPPKENRKNQNSNDSDNFSFMEAIIELKKFFTDYLSLLELGRQLRNAQGNERHTHTDVEAIFSLGNASIICGDFNAHHTSWGCQRNDTQGNIIRNLIDSTNTQIIAPTTPTRFGYSSASIIDFALTRNIHWPSQVESIAELSSDHNPLIISFDTNTRFAFPKRNVTTDWAAFRELLSPAHYTFHPITARTAEDVDTQVADLTDAIINTHTLSSKPIRSRNSYYVSDEIRKLMIERNRARKTWQLTRDPSDKRVLNTIQNRLHRKVKAFQNKIWEDELLALDPDDGSLWEMSKELRKKKSPVYAFKGQAGIAHTDSDKAEKAQIKRAPGREGITNKILRNLTLPVIFQITNIISNIFITGHFPESWKHASVIPILKPGKPRSAADSYRPISLLPVLSKLAERLILSRLNNHLTTNKILISQQHGFRPQLSTSHQLLRVVEYAKSGFKEKKCTGTVFLDIQKTFDRVWHTGLLYKLIKINAPPQLILIIKSFLNNRSFAVRVNDTHSSTKQIRAPQGTLLSPTLFNIYINDIPKTRHTTVCLYADDTAILTQSVNENCITHFLHRHLAELEDWYKNGKFP
ncbi:RNA-directed DNA polymerase from mobile element jockey [Trichonephila clavipes]|nr:RNA-directed DNA polymerase from mobile element jockey [Trichonephila clavipes]